MHAARPQRISAAPTSDPVIPATARVPARAFAAVVVANVALAFGPWFVRMADTGPVAAAFWRIALAAPLLIVGALASGARPVRLTPVMWLLLAASGIAFAADLASWHLGILRTTLANATLFGNSATLLFPLYGFVATRSLPTRMQRWALLLAFAGAALLMGRSYALDPRHLTGDLLCVLAGALYTVYLVMVARARTAMAPIPVLTISTVASIVPLLILALLMGERIVPTHWGPLVALALASQVLGQGAMVYALGKLPPLVIGIALLIQPIVAGTVGWIIYAERPGAADLIGAAMVAAALVLVRRPIRVAPAVGAAHLAAKDDI
ncbi:DMT family transporter [Sphingomonas bacterium]|uniref:DMT family transporter n=1 Tax=Sphingomonas bacterium TaxID=1895847 RepID=UPI001576F862|nr:DMT family transporter [Sphingomonas bacterium]